MDVQQLNADLCEILDKKIELNNKSYNDPMYDQIEEEIHELEDKFQRRYGDYLEEVMYGIHDEFCPDNEVLMPIAYIPGKVEKNEGNYLVDFKEGVYVEADDYGDEDTKLVMLPSPVRIIMQITPEKHEIVWQP